MRLWSLHPKYLDARGLVALWREGLLAQAVLRGETRGYRHHPQLERFRDSPAPLAAIALYLQAVHHEASRRGYAFDGCEGAGGERRRSRSPPDSSPTSGSTCWPSSPCATRRRWSACASGRPQCHPLFRVCPGESRPGSGPHLRGSGLR